MSSKRSEIFLRWSLIPDLNGRNPLRLRWSTAGSRSSTSRKRALALDWEPDHFIRPYSEAIRDRLVLYFEINRMNHKPKLVAVTGCSEGAGASTLAGGLAAALSERRWRCPSRARCRHGSRSCTHSSRRARMLAHRGSGRRAAQAGENLYLATATPADSQSFSSFRENFTT